MQPVCTVGWVGMRLSTPLRQNTDVSADYIADRGADDLGGNLEEPQFNSQLLHTQLLPSFLTSPGSRKLLIISLLHVFVKRYRQLSKLSAAIHMAFMKLCIIL